MKFIKKQIVKPYDEVIENIQHIIDFVNDEAGFEIEIEGFSVSEIVKAIESSGWNNDGGEPNGWDWDYDHWLTKGDRKITLRTNGYYDTSVRLIED